MAGFLSAFLAAERRAPFAWADKNCGLWVADWITLATGIDPAWPCRGLAASAEDWRVYCERHGGFAGLVVALMAAAEFPVTEAPQRGDVGIIVGPNGDELAAIRGDGVWIARTARGLHFQEFPTRIAWRIACRN